MTWVTSPSPPRTLEAARDRLIGILRDAGVDPDRVDLMPTVRSDVVSDGGNRQSNGRGTLMIGEAFARRMNPEMSRDALEREHRRVHGATKVLWLRHGPREEDVGRFEDGRLGIGTGGHLTMNPVASRSSPQDRPAARR